MDYNSFCSTRAMKVWGEGSDWMLLVPHGLHNVVMILGDTDLITIGFTHM